MGEWLEYEGHKRGKRVWVRLSSGRISGPRVWRVDEAQDRIEVTKTMVANALKSGGTPCIVGLGAYRFCNLVTEVTRSKDMQKSSNGVKEDVNTEKFLRSCMKFGRGIRHLCPPPGRNLVETSLQISLYGLLLLVSVNARRQFHFHRRWQQDQPIPLQYFQPHEPCRSRNTLRWISHLLQFRF